jgi:hypothetical protein
MGLPGRCSRWRPTPGPAERPRPDAFVPGRVLVGFEAGAGEQGRRTAAAAAADDEDGTTGVAPEATVVSVGLVDLADDDAWRRVDSVDGDDLDDVYAVTLGRGDTLDVSIASLSPDPVAAVLFDAGTTDVFGQLDQARACGGGAEVGCSTTALHFEADTRGTYLLDVFSTGSTGDYRLTWDGGDSGRQLHPPGPVHRAGRAGPPPATPPGRGATGSGCCSGRRPPRTAETFFR